MYTLYSIYNCQWPSLKKSFSFIVVITCEQLSNPVNGQVAVSGANVPGSIARYSCNQGFRLDGSATRVCSNDGRYSGVAPVCIGTDTHIIPLARCHSYI